jgi:hypothetical protein
MERTVDNLRGFVLVELPTLLIPIIVLVVGWIVALVASALVSRMLRRTYIDDRIAAKVMGPERATRVNTARWGGKVVYYLLLLITLVAFLETAQLSAAIEPINAMLAAFLDFIPNLVAAAAIVLVAWLAASLTRAVLRRGVDRWDIDRRLAREMAPPTAEPMPPPLPTPVGQVEVAEPVPEPRRAPVGRAVAEGGYWLVLLLFVPAVLDALTLQGLLAPVRNMLDKVLGFLPNLASAGLVAAIGWMVARIAQRLVTNALAGVGLNRLSVRVGLDRVLGSMTLASLVGLVTYILILVPVAVAALNALQLEAVTLPASRMLSSFFEALPAIFGAALVVALSYVAGRLLYGLIHRLLDGIGFDRALARIGLTEDHLGARTPSQLVAGLVMIAVIYFGALEAAEMLGFTALAALGTAFAVLVGRILLGLVIFGVGLYLARLAADAIATSNVEYARPLAITARGAVIILAAAMGLRQMGVANEIIELAFGLVLGAGAVAAALAFGLGGRDAASRTLEQLRERLQKRSGSHTSNRAAS